MSKIYIANCTKQVQQLQFRVPENPQIIMGEIPIGEQKLVWDGSTPAIQDIIEQLSAYGMVSVAELPRTKRFAGLCYSLDVPVKMDAIVMANRHNIDVLFDKGVEIRKALAVAVDKKFQRDPVRPHNTRIEFEEQAPKGQQPEHQPERYQVVREGEAPAAPKKRRKAA